VRSESGGTPRGREGACAAPALEYRVDLVRVERVIDEGRYAMDRARRPSTGRQPPAPPETPARPGRHDEPALDIDERGPPVADGDDGGGGDF
jgi:hypothetical protein